jgi:2-dehydro-3-deoxy-D-gluconate 5-dehydrogenase
LAILDQFKLDGKTALVTGCKRGIGKAMAIALAEAGADIIGVSQSLEVSGSDIEKEVTNRGRKFKGYACDFADRAEVYAFIHQVKSDFPVINILINNAGTILRKPAAEHPDEYWDKVIEINLNSQFVLAREIGKEMIARGAGKIIFTASLLTFQGGITVPGYAASNGARERMGGARCTGQRHRAGVYWHRQHGGVASRSGAQQRNFRTHSGRSLGES